jgi:hypothetical protein
MNRLVFAIVLSLGLASSPAFAETLCFEAADSIDVATCCQGGQTTSAAGIAGCDGLALGCTLTAGCTLTPAVDGGVRLVSGAKATSAVLWAPHACCVDGTLAPRPAGELSGDQPEPLTCTLTPGCAVAIPNHGKYAAAPVDLDGVPQISAPWTPQDFQMFALCAREAGQTTETCYANRLQLHCVGPICEPAYRDRVIAWLDKVIAAQGWVTPSPTDADKAPGAWLYTTGGEACCVTDTQVGGPFVALGALAATRCTYLDGCLPQDGDVLVYGDAAARAAKDGWTSLPAGVCAGTAADAMSPAQLTALTDRLARTQAEHDAYREQSESALETCQDDNDALKDAGAGGLCASSLAPANTLTIVGPSGSINVLENDDMDDPELLGISTAQHGVVVSQPGGEVTYFPNPAYLGTDILFYRVRGANGAQATGVLHVDVQ